MKIEKIDIEDLKMLKEISIETFRDTFESQNDPEDFREYLKNSFNDDKLKNELANKYSEFYFIYKDDKVAGYLKLNLDSAQTEVFDDALEVERIYIRKEFHRQGLGKILIQKAIERSLELNKKLIWLGVWEHNIKALEFYKKLDFFVDGEHSFIIGDDVQIDLIMKRYN